MNLDEASGERESPDSARLFRDQEKHHRNEEESIVDDVSPTGPGTIVI
jgi:hypothetical protein